MGAGLDYMTLGGFREAGFALEGMLAGSGGKSVMQKE